EVVVHDDAGRPSFGLLQQRAGLSGALETARAARHLPATYYVFDLLAAAGRDLRRVPLQARKRLLADLLPAAGYLRYSEHVERYGRRVFETARQLGLEGIVAKKADSPYRAGRSNDWIKVRARKTGDFVIVGWVAERGNPNAVGAIAVGEYRAGALCYAGRVGSGLNGADRARLKALLTGEPAAEPLADDKEIHWIPPRWVCEVEFREYTGQGHLRQPVFLRLRDDKRPEECVGHFDAPPVAEAAADDSAPSPSAVAAPPPDEVAISNPDKIYF